MVIQKRQKQTMARSSQTWKSINWIYVCWYLLIATDLFWLCFGQFSKNQCLSGSFYRGGADAALGTTLGSHFNHWIIVVVITVRTHKPFIWVNCNWKLWLVRGIIPKIIYPYSWMQSMGLGRLQENSPGLLTCYWTKWEDPPSNPNPFCHLA